MLCVTIAACCLRARSALCASIGSLIAPAGAAMTSQVEVDNLRGAGELRIAEPEHRVVEAGASAQEHKRGTLAH